MMSTKEEREILNKLKDLGMHETLTIDSICEVRRVPGGFLYVTTVTLNTASKSTSSTFVPFG